MIINCYIMIIFKIIVIIIVLMNCDIKKIEKNNNIDENKINYGEKNLMHSLIENFLRKQCEIK